MPHLVERYGERLAVALLTEEGDDGIEDRQCLPVLLHPQQDGCLLGKTHTQLHLPPILTLQLYGTIDITLGCVKVAHGEFRLCCSPTIHGNTGTMVDLFGKLECFKDVLQSLLRLLGIDIDGTDGVERRGDHLLVTTGTVHGVTLLGIAQRLMVVRLPRGTHGKDAQFIGYLVCHSQLAKHGQCLLAHDDGTVIELLFIITPTRLIETHCLLPVDRLLGRCCTHSYSGSTEKDEKYQFGEIITRGNTKEALKGTGERRLIVIAATIGNVKHSHAGDGIQQVACLLHAYFRDVALRRIPGNGRKSPTELRGTHCQCSGEFIHIDTVGLYLFGNDG